MLLVGECWRRTVKVAVLLLLAAELKLLDARPSRYLLRRHGSSAGGPRSAAVTDHDTATADSAPRRPWLTPCAGSTIAETETEAVRLEDSVDASTSSSSSSSSVGVDDLTTRHGRRRSLRRLARHMARLADRVDRLKQRYADHRFRDNVDTLDQLGFQLEGMPSPPQDVVDADTDEMVARALDDLTRVAPFLEEAVEGERRHERGRHFVVDYEHLLHHPEHGFYWILCELTRLRHSSSVDGDDDADAVTTLSAADFALPTASGAVQSNTIRHYRDYVVLRDFGRLLDSYRRQLWSRRGRHDRRASRSSRDRSAEV